MNLNASSEGPYLRAVLNPPKVSAVLRQMQPEAHEVFKDTYLLEFLDLPGDHAENLICSEHWSTRLFRMVFTWQLSLELRARSKPPLLGYL